MLKKVCDLNKIEKMKICYKSNKCINCQLHIDKWCLLKNSIEQMGNNLGLNTMKNYLNKIVEV